jgi:hypothetical protein
MAFAVDGSFQRPGAERAVIEDARQRQRRRRRWTGAGALLALGVLAAGGLALHPWRSSPAGAPHAALARRPADHRPATRVLSVTCPSDPRGFHVSSVPIVHVVAGNRLLGPVRVGSNGLAAINEVPVRVCIVTHH